MAKSKADMKRKQAKRLKQLCKEHGIMGISLAKLTGVSPSAVSQWMSGRTSIKRENAEQIEREYPTYCAQYLMGEWDVRNATDMLNSMMDSAAISILSGGSKGMEQLLAYAETQGVSVSLAHNIDKSYVGWEPDAPCKITIGQTTITTTTANLELLNKRMGNYLRLAVIELSRGITAAENGKK